MSYKHTVKFIRLRISAEGLISEALQRYMDDQWMVVSHAESGNEYSFVLHKVEYAQDVSDPVPGMELFV